MLSVVHVVVIVEVALTLDSALLGAKFRYNYANIDIALNS